MTQEIRVAHPFTYEGVPRAVNDVLEVEDLFAIRVVSAGLAAYTNGGPITPPRPVPLYSTDPYVRSFAGESGEISAEMVIDLMEPEIEAVRVALMSAVDRGEILLPAPTGVAANDNAALAAAIAAATGTSAIIIARKGTYVINAYHAIPDGVDLRGQGGGSTSRTGRTIFKCASGNAGISIGGGGGMSGHFAVDGDNVAATPFKRLGGTGANARFFENITVLNNTGANNDLVWFYGAQNDYWVQCGFANASRDIAVWDQGFGGATFVRCQWRNAGRYHHRYDDDVAGGVYAQPTDIHHYGGIMEGNAGTSLVIYNAAANVTYSDQAYYTINAPSGPMVDVVAGSGLTMHNPWLQCTSGAAPAGSIGIKVRGTGEMTVSGRAIMQSLETANSVDGAGAFIYVNCNWRYYGVTNRYGATGGGTVAQIATFQDGSRFVIAAATDFVDIAQPLARDRFLFSRTNLGVFSWYPNSAANFTPDVQLLRRGVGVLGVPNGTQQTLATGAGTTLQRPAAGAALNGASYFNSDTQTLQTCNGATWVDVATHAWVAATTAGITTNPAGSGAPIGYTKIGGVVHLRGLGGSVAATPNVLFTLPAGFRPAFQTNIPCFTMTGALVTTVGYLQISANGNVVLGAGSGAFVSFDGICFPAEQ